MDKLLLKDGHENRLPIYVSFYDSLFSMAQSDAHFHPKGYVQRGWTVVQQIAAMKRRGILRSVSMPIATTLITPIVDNLRLEADTKHAGEATPSQMQLVEYQDPSVGDTGLGQIINPDPSLNNIEQEFHYDEQDSSPDYNVAAIKRHAPDNPVAAGKKKRIMKGEPMS